MRDKIFRTVSGVLFAMSVGTLVIYFREWPGLDFSPMNEVMVIAALFLISPTLAVYALRGEQAAYKALIPGLALFHLPQILLEAVLSRVVEIPDVLQPPSPQDSLDDGGDGATDRGADGEAKRRASDGSA